MSTLYIHIGTPKTGTTAIQNFLLLNEDLLKKKGIAHPRVDVKGMREKFKSRRNGNFLVFNSPLTGEEKARHEQQVYQAGFEAVKESARTSEKIVLTDEAIWLRQNIRDDFWQKVKEDAANAGCEVKVIVYLRRQDLYIQAWWNQSIKLMTRLDQTFERYMNGGLSRKAFLDYYQKLNEIAECIGKENMIVRVYEKEMFLQPGGIYKNFLEALGERMEEEYQIPERDPNERLEGNFIEIKRVLNRIPEYKKMPLDSMYDPIIMASNMKKPEKVSYFSYEEQLQFLKKYEESNQRVAREFLGREDGILFTEPVEELPQWKIDYETLYQDIILFYGEVAFQQQRETEALKQKLAQTERKLADMERKMQNFMDGDFRFFHKVGRKIKKILKKIFKRGQKGV